MQAVVLIGGQGTRLRPITYTVPKALVPLRNKPYMHYLVDALRAAGLEGAVLSMGYMPDPIKDYFAGERLHGFSLEYVVEDRPLGTAGGIKNAERALPGDGPFVVTNGDVLTGLDLGKVIEAHQGSGALATITLTPVEDPAAYGLVEVDHELWVTKFVEKPARDEITTNLINAGIYVFEREVLDMIPEGQEVSIERDIFPVLQGMGSLKAYVSSSYWRDIGTPESYLCASHDVLYGVVGRSENFRHFSVHPSARVCEDAVLFPPVCVAQGCEVEAGAIVGSHTSMGSDCYVGKGATVEGSVLFEGVRVGEGAIVCNSIVGPGAEISEGSIVRGLSVLGAGCVVEERSVLDHGARVNPRVKLTKGVITF